MNWAAVLITLIVGPLTFFVWSHFFTKDTKLKKFPTGFNDGIGDSIFLPWFNGVAFTTLVWSALNAGIALIIALGFTAFFTLYSLRSPTKDWTTPKKGTLNAGGWYHAVFMCAQSGVIAYFLLTSFSIALLIPLAGYCLTVLTRFIATNTL